MTDLITRARKEWCEIHDPEGFAHTNVCPTYVIAALLDVQVDYTNTCDSGECVMPCCQTPSYKPHQPTCVLVLAEAAITRALEGK